MTDTEPNGSSSSTFLIFMPSNFAAFGGADGIARSRIARIRAATAAQQIGYGEQAELPVLAAAYALRHRAQSSVSSTATSGLRLLR